MAENKVARFLWPTVYNAIIRPHRTHEIIPTSVSLRVTRAERIDVLFGVEMWGAKKHCIRWRSLGLRCDV